MTKTVMSGKIYLRSSRCAKELSFFQRRAPVLADLLCSLCTKGKSLSGPVQNVILELFDVINNTFSIAQPSPLSYPEPQPNLMSFFPNMKGHRGRPIYVADREKGQTGLCRKESYGHPTLTPGIFAIFCPHGVALGFEVMQECESPWHPFDILAHQFPRPPKVVVYDNACKLHTYALNREPDQGVQFLLFRLIHIYYLIHLKSVSKFSQGYHTISFMRNLRLFVSKDRKWISKVNGLKLSRGGPTQL